MKLRLGSLPWMGWTTAKFAAGLIRDCGLQRVLEIGTLHGVGTCYLAVTGAAVTTVDLPHSVKYTPTAEETLALCGLSAEIVRRPSREALVEWVIEGRAFDLVYVDGGHTLPDVLCDVLLADQLLRPGGWLILDDIANAKWPDVAKVWAWLPARYERRPGPTPGWGVAQKLP